MESIVYDDIEEFKNNLWRFQKRNWVKMIIVVFND